MNNKEKLKQFTTTLEKQLLGCEDLTRVFDTLQGYSVKVTLKDSKVQIGISMSGEKVYSQLHLDTHFFILSMVKDGIVEWVNGVKNG